MLKIVVFARIAVVLATTSRDQRPCCKQASGPMYDGNKNHQNHTVFMGSDAHGLVDHMLAVFVRVGRRCVCLFLLFV